MSEQSEQFLAKSAIKAADLTHRQTIQFNIGRYNAAVPKGKSQFVHLNHAREMAKNVKWRAIETLDQQLELFERHFTERGGKVIWAEDAQQATDAILKICREKQCKTLVKSKSMVTEEIHLNRMLEQHGIESVETDLGEYIQQLDGEAPYHIVTPAMHKSKEDVARLFSDKLGTPPNLTPEELTLTAREILRKKFVEAEVGVTGANFIISDIGAVAVTENEGNARLCTAFPKTHIVVVGIEKVIPSLTDLALFWPLLSTYGTGQTLTVYNSIFSGPRQPNETDGPEEMIVILLDNGRTNILKNPVQRESLYCIRCGACLNACPVYKNIGGHAYGATYSGPIGSVITPHLQGLDEYKHLSYASSLCGNCTEVCAVKINLHELLLHNREESVSTGHTTFTERMAWKMWKFSSLNRRVMNAGNGKLKNKVVNKIFTQWTKNRGALSFSAKTFNQMWKDKHP
ncbi:MAG TPA: LutB/LldF family L-lactate oxidation iron-sulfur protein [Ferruginibacter sp.]|nr:LutB/LldF family L-lactate oxidation iron-sulfur protein [Ferruginibacter sp.]HRO06521.1 LutB/LldF family L-lactate oxidation iron-sulfur protein [Ferruginibacter sp.]HRO95454.1 LutB/LldF family L-lactate oxidation iron-sulfur protein [Ferruginibacter sp.]HRP49960.1 LutB/LldF family L-lactate oxidation iron-sulfur protein [Ferruginibacter sp.]